MLDVFFAPLPYFRSPSCDTAASHTQGEIDVVNLFKLKSEGKATSFANELNDACTRARETRRLSRANFSQGLRLGAGGGGGHIIFCFIIQYLCSSLNHFPPHHTHPAQLPPLLLAAATKGGRGEYNDTRGTCEPASPRVRGIQRLRRRCAYYFVRSVHVLILCSFR